MFCPLANLSRVSAHHDTPSRQTKRAATVHSEMKSVVVLVNAFHIDPLRLVVLFTNIYYRTGYGACVTPASFPRGARHPWTTHTGLLCHQHFIYNTCNNIYRMDLEGNEQMSAQ